MTVGCRQRSIYFLQIITKMSVLGVIYLVKKIPYMKKKSVCPPVVGDLSSAAENSVRMPGSSLQKLIAKRFCTKVSFVKISTVAITLSVQA